MDGFAIRGTPILGRLVLDVARGETVALTGPSGIGKTTLLRIIAGLETGYHGKVRLRGVPAVVFQEPTLLRWRTLAQNLCLATRISERDALDHLARVGLADKADLFPDQLSLGQQRRLSLARAFALRPDILLMDEPFVSLDPSLAEEMMTLFEKLRADDQPATLLITHEEREAERLADRIVRLDGRPAVVV
ncbi:MAG: ABC transporter ATP-binding protein [Marivivens sp.]|nr:ABC transporter ATP-binding protein [Marivivens sp.]NCW69342.1 ABC transporter ATP-binding protein [Marivivens sp.]NVJ96359.1 ABC transporter ATP-binding protein [Marivivens sp.]